MHNTQTTIIVRDHLQINLYICVTFRLHCHAIFQMEKIISRKKSINSQFFALLVIGICDRWQPQFKIHLCDIFKLVILRSVKLCVF